MKRAKEILLLIFLFIIFFFLNLVLYIPSMFTESNYPSFAGGIYYLKLILSDKTFLPALINQTIHIIGKPFISSVVLISLSCAILKNKIKSTRKSFYLTAFATSFIISVACLILNVALNNILGYIFIPIQIGLLCLMVFWVLELIVNTIKNFRRKRDEI